MANSSFPGFMPLSSKTSSDYARIKSEAGVCLVGKRFSGESNYMGLCSGNVIKSALAGILLVTSESLFSSQEELAKVKRNPREWNDKVDYVLCFKSRKKGQLKTYQLHDVMTSNRSVIFWEGLVIIPLDSKKLSNNFKKYRPFNASDKKLTDPKPFGGSICRIVKGNTESFVVESYWIKYVNGKECVLIRPGSFVDTSYFTASGALNECLASGGGIFKDGVFTGVLSFIDDQILLLPFWSGALFGGETKEPDQSKDTTLVGNKPNQGGEHHEPESNGTTLVGEKPDLGTELQTVSLDQSSDTGSTNNNSLAVGTEAAEYNGETPNDGTPDQGDPANMYERQTLGGVTDLKVSPGTSGNDLHTRTNATKRPELICSEKSHEKPVGAPQKRENSQSKGKVGEKLPNDVKYERKSATENDYPRAVDPQEPLVKTVERKENETNEKGKGSPGPCTAGQKVTRTGKKRHQDIHGAEPGKKGKSSAVVSGLDRKTSGDKAEKNRDRGGDEADKEGKISEIAGPKQALTVALRHKPSSEELLNGYRLARLLLEGGSMALRRVFDFFHPPEVLATHLNDNYTHLKDLLGRGKLNSCQWELLFPLDENPTSSRFDISLLFCLLRNICGLSPPETGWDREPDSDDFSVEADIVRVRFFRNQFFHCQPNLTCGVDTPTFSTLGDELCKVYRRLEVSEDEINELKTDLHPETKDVGVQTEAPLAITDRARGSTLGDLADIPANFIVNEDFLPESFADDTGTGYKGDAGNCDNENYVDDQDDAGNCDDKNYADNKDDAKNCDDENYVDDQDDTGNCDDEIYADDKDDVGEYHYQSLSFLLIMLFGIILALCLKFLT